MKNSIDVPVDSIEELRSVAELGSDRHSLHETDAEEILAWIESVLKKTDVSNPMNRDEIIWSAAFAVAFDPSPADAMMQGKAQTREDFSEVRDAFLSRCAHEAARKADRAVRASHGVDALALGEGVF